MTLIEYKCSFCCSCRHALRRHGYDPREYGIGKKNILSKPCVNGQVLMTQRKIALRSGFMTISTLRIIEYKLSAETPRWINCEDPAYQSSIVSQQIREQVPIPSGNEVLRRGDMRVGLSLRKSGGWGESGGIPQINTLSLHKTMIIVVFTIIQSINELDEKILEKMEKNLRGIVTVISMDVCGESC